MGNRSGRIMTHSVSVEHAAFDQRILGQNHSVDAEHLQTCDMCEQECTPAVLQVPRK